MTPGLILKWCEWPRVDPSYECPLLTQSVHSASAVQPVELLGLLAKLLGISVFAGRNGCLRFYATPAQWKIAGDWLMSACGDKAGHHRPLVLDLGPIREPPFSAYTYGKPIKAIQLRRVQMLTKRELLRSGATKFQKFSRRLPTSPKANTR